jgi:hypothetical protein
MIVFTGRRGCGCSGCLTLIFLIVIAGAIFQMMSGSTHAPGAPVHPVYPVNLSPTPIGGGFS